MQKDPACRNLFEAMFLYPAVTALLSHERAHRLYLKATRHRRDGFHTEAAIKPASKFIPEHVLARGYLSITERAWLLGRRRSLATTSPFITV